MEEWKENEIENRVERFFIKLFPIVLLIFGVIFISIGLFLEPRETMHSGIRHILEPWQALGAGIFALIAAGIYFFKPKKKNIRDKYDLDS
jgi:O-antigen/teichoic acid export membrane protein